MNVRGCLWLFGISRRCGTFIQYFLEIKRKIIDTCKSRYESQKQMHDSSYTEFLKS